MRGLGSGEAARTTGLGLVAEDGIESIGNVPLADPLDRCRTGSECLHDAGIRPAGMRFEQNTNPDQDTSRVFPGVHHLLQPLTLATREADVISLDHSYLQDSGIPQPTPEHHQRQIFLDGPLVLQPHSATEGPTYSPHSEQHRSLANDTPW